MRKLSLGLKQGRADAVIASHPRLRAMLGEMDVRMPRDVAVAAISVLHGNLDAGVDENVIAFQQVAMRTLAGLVQQNERVLPRYDGRVRVDERRIDGSSLPALMPSAE